MDDANNTCAICLETVETNKNVATTECKHTFCLNCLIRWTRTRPICPICRTKLVEDTPIIPVTTMTSVSTYNTNIHSSSMVFSVTNDDLPPNWPYC